MRVSIENPRAEALSETVSLPPKVEVRSAYTLSSSDSTRGTVLLTIMGV